MNNISQVLNPFLPGWEYIPDAEPHVFGDRVYIYGSHDRFGAPIFCVNDYVCWSAGIDNLAEWKYEGVIYKKNQDPMNRSGHHCLYAPDVTKGPDGRFYLYYALDFVGRIGVAVCDSPAGQYEFLGNVRFSDGHEWGSKSREPFPFDPGVLTDDDGRVYLYSGFAKKVPFFMTGFRSLTNEGGVVIELEQDMCTIKNGPELLFSIKGRKGAFKNHAFFEASSMRKVDSKYCFVYSSEHNHELCYAMSDHSKGLFEFGGILVDIGDLYLDGNVNERRATNYLGNTHGGLLKIGNDWYIFYHRQTNQNSYCRQACAEKLEYHKLYGFKQAEGTYEARIACNLWSKKGTGRYDKFFTRLLLHDHPYFTQDSPDRECDGDQYIKNMRAGSVAGFKYFKGNHSETISIEVNGHAKGRILISLDPGIKDVVSEIEVNGKGKGWKNYSDRISLPEGTYALYFSYQGKGCIGFRSFTLMETEQLQ
ncbi:MAG: family 43 glycosylhydrolase [Lachnospiraceae bacterium]|nr:family 43 glycosylhydrolase [Lachnospiraceae bacterium]MDD3659937.1 family 43 glycosylhydrolase [Lachnospiraceae bacterium]